MGDYAWREGDVAAIAKNFYLNGYNIFYPQVDWRADTPGYVQSEFPLYSYVIALFYPIFGVHIIIGRITSLLLSISSLIIMYHLVKHYENKKTALFAMFFLAIAPVFVHMSRNLQPESMVTFFSLASLYFFSKWLDKENSWLYFVLATTTTAFAFLVKMPVVLYLPFSLLFLGVVKYRLRIFTRWKLWLFLILVLTPFYYWYYIHTVSLYEKTGLSFELFDFKMQQTPDEDPMWGPMVYPLYKEIGWYKTVFIRRVFFALGLLGGILALLGIFVKPKNHSGYFTHFLFLGISVFLIFAAKRTFIHHYYILPVVIPMSIFAARSLSRITELQFLRGSKERNFIRYGVVTGILLYSSIMILLHSPIPHRYDPITFEMFSKIDQIIPDNELVVTDMINPSYMYYANIQGWRIPPEGMTFEFIEYAKERGAKYVVRLESSFLFENNSLSKGLLNASYDIVLYKVPDHFVIINLSNRRGYTQPIKVSSNKNESISEVYKIESLIDGKVADNRYIIAEVTDNPERCNTKNICSVNFTFTKEIVINRIDVVQNYQKTAFAEDVLKSPNSWADYSISYYASNGELVEIIPYQKIPLSTKLIKTTHNLSTPIQANMIQVRLFNPNLPGVYYVALGEVLFYTSDGEVI